MDVVTTKGLAVRIWIRSMRACTYGGATGLSVIAYNLGNLWRRLVLPKGIGTWTLTSLQQRLVKAGGRLVKHGRNYWLMLGGEPPHAALVWKYSAADGGIAAASRVGAAARRNQSGRTSGVDEEVSEKSLQNGANHGFLAWAEDPRGRKGALPLERMRKRREPGTQGCILSSPDKQNGNPGSIQPKPTVVR